MGVGLLVTAVFLWLFLRDVPFREVAHVIAGTRWGVLLGLSIPAYVLAVYALLVVPRAVRRGAPDIRMGFTLGQLTRSTARALRDLNFLKTMLLIGIPTKAVLTGVVIFALIWWDLQDERKYYAKTEAERWKP